jgi:hypothetical protein
VWSWQSDRLNGVTDLTVIYVTLLMLIYLKDTSVIAKAGSFIEHKISESLLVLQNQEKLTDSEKNVWLNVDQERPQT